MALLEVNNLRFKYEDVDLYNDISFKVNPKEHIIIVGDNGCGKSTFLKLISKNLIPDKGSILWQNNIKYSYLDQHLKVIDDVTIEDYIISVFKPLFEKEKLMNSYYEKLAYCNENEYEKWMGYAESIQNELDKANFYRINSTLGNIYNGLGIIEYGLNTKLKNLSGGQREKVFLAKLLLEEPDVLIMDEPTNFLDSRHIEWLTKYLKEFKGSFIVVSHDELFLSEIGDIVYDLDNKNLVKYNMKYELYLKEREIRKEQYIKDYNKQQEFIKKTEEFIQKNIVRATTSKQAKSRRKMLEKIDRLEKPKNHEPMHLKFPFSKELGMEVLKLDNLCVGYGDKIVLENLNFLLTHNQKVVILGKNGVGKSTILKTIIGEIEKLSGEYKWNNSAILNYFKQEELYDNLVNPIEYLRYFYHDKTDYELRTILGSAGIKGELQTKPMKTLSGGEQTKVRLALMTMKKSNVLIFDEPTNHLDILSKAELWDSINDFPGSVILVTHEDDFYEGLVDLKFEIS